MNISKSAQQLADQAGQPQAVDQVCALTERIAQQAVGHKFTVRLDSKRVVTGTISRCEPHDVRVRGSHSIRGTFRVWLLCGINQVERGPFVVQRVPG